MDSSRARRSAAIGKVEDCEPGHYSIITCLKASRAKPHAHAAYLSITSLVGRNCGAVRLSKSCVVMPDVQRVRAPKHGTMRDRGRPILFWERRSMRTMPAAPGLKKVDLASVGV